MKTLMLIFVVLCISFVLNGCTTWGSVKTGVAINSAKAADEELITARWMTCDAATAGALRRKYANDPAGMLAWREFCSNQSDMAVAP